MKKCIEKQMTKSINQNNVYETHFHNRIDSNSCIKVPVIYCNIQYLSNTIVFAQQKAKLNSSITV